MPLPKPTAKSNWGISNPDFANRVVEPSTAKKQAAWLDDERPPAPIANWLWYIDNQWINYFESITDAHETNYTVIIGTGPGATHATLQAAVNDVALGADLRVRVDASAVINTTVTLTKARWRIDFSPGVVYSKGAATAAISMQADGLVINYGRFTGWTGGGDAAIRQTAAGEYCSVLNSRFGPATTVEVDQTLVPVGKAGPVSQTITEV